MLVTPCSIDNRNLLFTFWLAIENLWSLPVPLAALGVQRGVSGMRQQQSSSGSGENQIHVELEQDVRLPLYLDA